LKVNDIAQGLIGASVPRKEDAALLSGGARFIDDLSPVPGIRHVAILRSPHPHARIVNIDVSRAMELPGVAGVVTGAQIADAIKPIPSAVHAPIEYYPMAVDVARYAGEPVALVAASDRYVAEDALELIDITYEALPPAVDIAAAMQDDAPLLHPVAGSNVVHHRSFSYGDPDAAFEEADHIVRLDWRFPRYSSTPIETYGAVVNFERNPDRYSIWSNFQGPFILHALMSGALGVRGNGLRLITAPNSGGSFGIKQGLYPYLILLAAASRIIGAPLKWIEDRLEHLTGSSAAADRMDKVEAAFTSAGELTGLRFDNVVDVGAYVRAPEPASVYRMHAASNGCYRVQNIAVENRLVVTNRTPVGLNRGYGGPQFYFALERAMDSAAHELGIDIAEIRRINFIGADEFPYHAPAGATYDSGDYAAGLDEAIRIADYTGLKAQQEEARRSGRLFGIGIAAGIEPSGSNMAYVTLAQTPEERAKSGGRSGALASATVGVDPSGSVTVRTVSTPAGQGHVTVAAQIVAETLGLRVEDVEVVTEIDTLTSTWSLASGNYANRFSSIVIDAIAQASIKVADKLRLIASDVLEVAPEDIEFVGGSARIVGVPEKAVAVRRLAAGTHWHPVGLPDGMSPGLSETVILSPEMLGEPDKQDRVGSAVTFGYVCDIAAVEIDPQTGRVDVRKYVSAHDVGTLLNPLIVEGQVWGGFAHGVGGALFEEMAYDAAGNPLSGSFADYLCVTAPEMPKLDIGHITTPSPHNSLGAKGMGDGSSMLVPAAIGNAVADALGRSDIELPLTLNRSWDLANGRVHVRADTARPKIVAEGGIAPGGLTGEGSVHLSSSPEDIWQALLDPIVLSAIVPGCQRLERVADDRFEAEVIIGVAGIRGAWRASIELKDMTQPSSLRMVGKGEGTLGFGQGEGVIALTATPDGGTELTYTYHANVGGKIASVGQRMLGTVTKVLIGQFFRALEHRMTPGKKSFWARWFGGSDV
jgi:2-furoyl-CoA dehydrogenase large subunit